jgi:D-3-phosphoglycerate dehydrogenase / 2-oxoglutarate reductase
MRILISDQNFGDGARVERELAEQGGWELVVADCRTEEDVAEALGRHRPDALLVQFAPVGARALSDANGLAAIVRYGVGVDNIAVDVAQARGIAVGRVPDYCIEEVAEHTIALLLAVERRVVELAVQTRAGGWDWHAAKPTRRVGDLRLGLVGFGQIARAVALRASAFGMRLAAHDPAVEPHEMGEQGVEALAFEDLLARSDVLSLHVPLTEETRGLIGRAQLELLPEGAIVLNAARGGLVDEVALAGALASGRLRGAGVDVLEEEPPPTTHPLRTAPGAVVTPHTAWYSETAVAELRRKAVETAIALAAR